MNQLANPANDTTIIEGEIDTGLPLAVRLAQAELDQSIVTARQYPRSLVRAAGRIKDLVMLDEESAAECVYALPRAGKVIKGPSVRFAEVVASQWGNCQVGSRVIAVDRVDKVVIAEGVFHDLETGMKRVAQVRRRIVNRQGQIFNDDMITTTGNAACSVAMREAVLKGIPKAIWRAAYNAAESVIIGDTKTMVERRDKSIAAFAVFGVTADMICEALEIEGIAEMGTDEITALLAMHGQIKSKETPVEVLFPAVKGKPKPKAAAKAKPKVEQKTEAKAKPVEKEPTKTDAGQDDQKTDADDKPAVDNEVLAKQQGIYNDIAADMLDAPSRDALLEVHGDKIEAMAKTAPDLHKQLMSEIDAQFSAGDGDKNA